MVMMFFSYRIIDWDGKSKFILLICQPVEEKAKLGFLVSVSFHLLRSLFHFQPYSITVAFLWICVLIHIRNGYRELMAPN